ncbi:MAG: GerMN domain-containing protein [Spirochaetaceae bacterium]|nr:GerMN domain-containing protein [Spirochaetaceae bacterium]
MNAIQTSLRNTGVVDFLLNRPVKGRNILLPEEEEAEDAAPETDRLYEPSGPDNSPSWESPPLETAPPPTASEPPAETQETEDPALTEPRTAVPQERTDQPEPPRARVQQQNSPEARRERALYLVEVDPDGTILRTKVTRNLPATNSPLVDALNVLLQGPSAEETSRGLISLIPRETRLLSASVRGSTAYINFNENFLFNEYGVEGYAGQLKQIVWTATEFSNITDVQILIEGRRMDYLGESIWIGSPIGRESR